MVSALLVATLGIFAVYYCCLKRHRNLKKLAVHDIAEPVTVAEEAGPSESQLESYLNNLSRQAERAYQAALIKHRDNPRMLEFLNKAHRELETCLQMDF